MEPGITPSTITSHPSRGAIGSARSGAKLRRLKRRAKLFRGRDRGGDGGQSAPSPLSDAWGDTLTRSDMVTLGLAVRRDWPIPADRRQAFVDLLTRTFEGSEDVPRVSIAAARVCVDMEASNIRHEQDDTFPLDQEPTR